MIGTLYFDPEVFIDRESIPEECVCGQPEGPNACMACGLGSLPEVKIGGWRAPEKQWELEYAGQVFKFFKIYSLKFL